MSPSLSNAGAGMEGLGRGRGGSDFQAAFWATQSLEDGGRDTPSAVFGGEEHVFLAGMETMRLCRARQLPASGRAFWDTL